MRPAERADNERLCRLFASVPMEGDLSLAVERDPDFFALYDLQRADAHTVLVEVEGQVEGLASALGRDGYLGGERVRVGYAGDLRLTRKVRGGFFLGRVYGPGFREACRTFGCEVMYTAIFASNQVALRSLVKRSKRLPDKPVYRHWVDFDILNLHFTRRRRPRSSPFSVRRASEDDVPALAAFLHADHRRRPFGYVLDEELLRWRLARWPGLRPESFYLAFAGDELRGVVAPWDADAVKRFRVLAYRNHMRWIKRAYNLGAFFARYPPLPPPGQLLRYAYLSHVSVPDDDPRVFTALLDHVYADLCTQGYHFLTCFRLADDPLAAAFARYTCTPLAAKLFTVSSPGSVWNERGPGPGRPGFEMCLV